MIRGDLGKWHVGDTISNFPDDYEGPDPNYAEIAGAKLTLHALGQEESSNGTALNIWAEVSKNPLNPGFDIQFGANAVISFDVEAHLDDPAAAAGPCLIGLNGGVYLRLEFLSGVALDYVFDRDPDRSANEFFESHGIDFWREVFLDPAGGHFQRDLYADMLTIPAIAENSDDPGNFVIIGVMLEISDPGWCSFDNLYIGSPLPSVSIAAAGDPCEEGLANGHFIISRTGPTNKAINVSLAVETQGDDEATETVDYAALPRSVRIPAGQTSVTIDVEPIQDDLSEPAETVTVSITAPSGYVTGVSQATVSIADDDLPMVTIAAADGFAGETSGGVANTGQFKIRRAGDLSRPMTVFFEIAGQAANGEDYDLLADWVTLGPDEGQALITVAPIDDAVPEETEDVVLTLQLDPFDPEAYRIGEASRAGVLIRDNDFGLSRLWVGNSIMVGDVGRVVWNAEDRQPGAIADALYSSFLNPGGVSIEAVFAAVPPPGATVRCVAEVFAGDQAGGTAIVTHHEFLTVNGNTGWVHVPLPAGPLRVGRYTLQLSFHLEGDLVERTAHPLYMVLNSPPLLVYYPEQDFEVATEFAAGAATKAEAMETILANFTRQDWNYRTIAGPAAPGDGTGSYWVALAPRLLVGEVSFGNCYTFAYAFAAVARVVGVGDVRVVSDPGRHGTGFLTGTGLTALDGDPGNAMPAASLSGIPNRWHFSSHAFVREGATWWDPTFTRRYAGQGAWWDAIDSVVEGGNGVWPKKTAGGMILRQIGAGEHRVFTYEFLVGLPAAGAGEASLAASGPPRSLDTDGDGLANAFVVDVDVIGPAGEYVVGGALLIGDQVVSSRRESDSEDFSTAVVTVGAEGVAHVSVTFSGEDIRCAGLAGEAGADLYLLDGQGALQDSAFLPAGPIDPILFGEREGFVGPVGTELVDVDGDGVIDRLDVLVDVFVTTGGAYVVAASLAPGDGRVESTSQRVEVAGASAVTLSFDAELLFRADPAAASVGVTLWGAARCVDSGGASLAGLAGAELAAPRVTGLAVTGDHGMDLDSDGLFDVLAVDLQAVVAVAARYDLEAWLCSGDGRFIARATGWADLAPGPAAATLLFDGSLIGSSSQDGPYVLQHVLVRDQAGDIVSWFDAAGVTGPYEAADFEGGAGPVSGTTYVLAIGVRDEPSAIAGDLAAQRVHDAFALLPNVSVNRLMMLDSALAGNRERIVSAVLKMSQIVGPGDTFVLYFGSHGGYQMTGDELPVMAQYSASDLSARRLTTGDETMYLSQWGGSMTDDEFSQLFVASPWEQVNKLFIMDTCFSGGHIGSTALGDTGDLSRLSHTGVIAAAAEGDFGWARWDESSQRYIHVLATAVANAVMELRDAERITYQDLFLRASAAGSVFDGDNGRILTVGPDLQESWTVDAAVHFQPAITQSRGFSGSVVGMPTVTGPPGPDLVCTLANTSVPLAVLVGQQASGRVQVRIANGGAEAVPAGRRVDVRIVARPLDGSPDIHLLTLRNRAVGRLKPGRTKWFNVTVRIPAEVGAGEYVLVALVDTLDCVDESREDNNSAAASGPAVLVAPAFVDIVASLGRQTLAPAVVPLARMRGSVRVVLTNAGNVALPAGQRVTVDLVAVSRTDGTEKLLRHVQNVSVSKLRAGRSKTLTLRVNCPSGLDAGADGRAVVYDIVALVQPVGALPEEALFNNAVPVRAITAAAPFVDLTATLNTARLNLPAECIAGDGRKITLPVVVTNEGNVPLERGAKIHVGVYTRPHDAVDDSRDQPVLRSPYSMAVSRLGVGRSKTLYAAVYLPPGLATDEYHLVAKADVDDTVAEWNALESGEGNNEAVTPLPMDVEYGHVDLSGAMGDVSLVRQFVAGTTAKGTAKVTVRNDGNVPLPKSQPVKLLLTFTPVGGGGAIVLATVPLPGTGLGPGGSRLVTVPFSLPGDLAVDQYRMELVLDCEEQLDESDETNNCLVHPDTWQATPPPPDLVATATDLPSGLDLQTWTYVTFVVANQGSGPARPTYCEVLLSRNRVLNEDDWLLAEFSVPALAASESYSTRVRLDTNGLVNPFDFPLRYYVLAVADAGNAESEGVAGEGNNTRIYPVLVLAT